MSRYWPGTRPPSRRGGRTSHRIPSHVCGDSGGAGGDHLGDSHLAGGDPHGRCHIGGGCHLAVDCHHLAGGCTLDGGCHLDGGCPLDGGCLQTWWWRRHWAGASRGAARSEPPQESLNNYCQDITACLPVKILKISILWWRQLVKIPIHNVKWNIIYPFFQSTVSAEECTWCPPWMLNSLVHCCRFVIKLG